MTTQHRDTRVIFEKISSWTRLLKVVALLVTWIVHAPGFIKAEHVSRAKTMVIRYYQQLYLHEACETIKARKTISKKHWLHTL